MKSKISKTLPLILFAVSSLVDFWAIYTQKPQVIVIVKPMLMLSLLWYYVANTSKRIKFYILALVFSFFGDVFLLNKDFTFFIAGLLSFLIAHFFYISIVYKMLQKVSFNQLSKAILPNSIILIVLLNVLFPGLGVLKIPVIIYALTLCSFSTVALLYYFQNKTRQGLLILAGAFLFVISDSVLALNMFYKAYSFFPLLIMSTYLVAQFLICKFVLLKEKK